MSTRKKDEPRILSPPEISEGSSLESESQEDSSEQERQRHLIAETQEQADRSTQDSAESNFPEFPEALREKAFARKISCEIE